MCLCLPADHYSHADASTPIALDSPRLADSNAPCPDAVRPLVAGLSILLYLSSPGKYLQIVGYWVLQACGRFETYTIRSPSASGVQWDPSRRCRTSAPWDICLEHPAALYSHSDASKPTPLGSSRLPDSNAHCADAVRPLAEWLCILLYLSSPGKYVQIVGYWVLQACGRFRTYTIRFPSASGLPWGPARLCRTSACWGISLFHPADRYRHAAASEPIPFDSPRPADAKEPCPDAVRPLVVELSEHVYLSSLGKYCQIVGYWVLQPCGRFETYTIRSPSASGLQWDPSRLCRTSAPWDICLLHPADLYSHSDASKPTPFDSSGLPDSNAHCPDAVRPLAGWLCIHLYLCSPGKYPQIVGYWVLQACGRFKTYTIRFPTAGGLQWDPSRLWRTSALRDICLFHPAACYSDVDAPKPLPFDSPRRADSNETLPDSGGYLPAKVSAFFTLLTSIAMWTLRELYHSIPLAERNPTDSLRTLSDRRFKGYPYFCTLALWAGTFKLLDTEYYCFLD